MNIQEAKKQNYIYIQQYLNGDLAIVKNISPNFGVNDIKCTNEKVGALID